MKKVIFGVLCGVLILSIATGCDNSNSENNNSLNNNSNESSSSSKYQLKINGTVLGFPFKLEKLLNMGLEISESDMEKLKNSSNEYEYVNLIGDVFTVADLFVVPNKNINDAMVIGIRMPEQEVEENYVLELNGLKRGKSTIDDVLNQFGNPEQPQEIDKTLYINTFSYNGGKLIFGFQEGVLISIQYLEDNK